MPALGRASVRDGHWELLQCVPAWDGFVAFAWRGAAGEQLVVAVNYAGNQGQCYVRLPFPNLAGSTLRFSDLMGEARYDRDGNDLASRGLFLDLPPWGYHVFEVKSL